MEETLRIQLFEDFKLSYRGIPVTGLNRPRLKSLFAYLAIHPGVSYSRAHLAYTFWPDSNEPQALTNLRKHLHMLRHTIPDAERYFYADSLTLGWYLDAPYSLDVQEFDNNITAAEKAMQIGNSVALRQSLERAVDLYRGNLLPDLYDEWVLAERERLDQRYTRAMNQLITLLEDQREYATAERYTQHLLLHEPVNETTYRQLMRLQALNGERAAALRTYHTCVTVLSRELGVDPSRATQDVYQQLLGEELQHTPLRESVPGKTPLIGRHGEWLQLKNSWHDARNGPQFVLLLGETGIGKTRLAEELLDWASRQGVPTALTRCYQSGADLAYAPLVSWLRTEAFRKRWSSLESIWLSELSLLLPEILSENPGVFPPAALPSTLGQQRLFDALLHAVLVCRQVLLILDDLQWCDSGTLDWLTFLFAATRSNRADIWDRTQILIVATMRGEYVDRASQIQSLQQDLQHAENIKEIWLNPLSEEETAVLARQAAEYELTPDQIVKLYRETEGNPFFVVETIRARLTAQMPHRVQQVLAARLSQLSRGARRLAGQAAVIGREFTYDLLHGISQEDEVAIINALDELWCERIIQERGKNSYEFIHPMIQAAASNLLSPVARRFAHRQIALALEEKRMRAPVKQMLQLPQGNVPLFDDIDAQIADHYELADEPEKAVPFYRLAAEAARKVYATHQAISIYRRGLHVANLIDASKLEELSLLDEKMRLLEGLGEALEFIGEHIQAREAFTDALEVMLGKDALRTARLHHQVGDTFKSQGDYVQAAQAYDRAEAAISQVSDSKDPDVQRQWLDLQFSRIFMYYGQGDTERMLLLGEQISDRIAIAGTLLQKAEFYRVSSAMRCRRTRYVIDDETFEYARQSLQAYLELGDLDGITEARFGLGFVSLWRGDLEVAEENLNKCLEDAQQINKENLVILCLAYLSMLYRIKGNAEQCQSFSLRCLEQAERSDMPTYAGLARANLAWLAWKGRDKDTSWDQAHSALNLWHNSVFPFQWTAHFLIVNLALEAEDHTKAILSARAVLDSTQQRLPKPLHDCFSDAIIAWDQGNNTQAVEALARGIAHASHWHFL